MNQIEASVLRSLFDFGDERVAIRAPIGPGAFSLVV